MGDRAIPRRRLSVIEDEAIMTARREGLELSRLVSDALSHKSLKDSTDNKGKRNIELISDIRTIEDALAYAEIDLGIWEVTRSLVNKWEMGFKDKSGEARSQGLWQVKVWLTRRVSQGLVDAMEAIHKRAEQYSPDYTDIEYPAPVEDAHLLEMSLYDMHFGKLAWAVEGTNDYDLNIAEALFENAIVDLLAYMQNINIDRIVFPVGNDFLHVDNKALTTEAGTEQGAQTEGRYAKIVETGFVALVRAIDRMVKIAPVDIIFVAGNHDGTSTYHIVRELKAWYRKHKSVNVNCGPRSRKYYEYGTTLLGYTHGHAETMARLLNLMPVEAKEAWGRTDCHEWHTGHLHKRKVTQTTPIDTYEGTTVRVLPSLTGTDEWHFRKGYYGSRAAEAYLYHKMSGYVGHFATRARQ